MKKFISYLLPLLSVLAFSACNEDYDDWADPQTNDPDAAVTVKFDITAASAAAIDLKEITTDSVEVVKLSSIDNPEGTNVSYTVSIDKDEKFASRLAYPVENVNGSLLIAVSDLSEATETLYGKRPEARNLQVRANAYIKTEAGQSVLAQSQALSIIVTPTAPIIDSNYYMIGTMNGWNGDDVKTLIKFDHSGGDVYDNPIFTLTINVPANCNWKLVPQKLYDAVASGAAENVWADGILGNEVDNNPALEGKLTVRAGDYDPGAMLIEEKGWVKITLDMMAYTYKVEMLGDVSPMMYVPGGHQGWNPSEAPILYSPNFDMKYDGYVYFPANNEFKFTPQPNWDNDYADDGTQSGILVEKGENIKTSEEGHYRLTVDLTNMTYATTRTEWGLIGDATEGGWDDSTPMVLNQENGEWTVTTTLKDGEFKFRANNGWDINLGGDQSNLGYGGDNIRVEAGTYLITLRLGDPKAYSCTLTKQ